MVNLIRCMCCGRELPSNWGWYVCDACGYRICPNCLNKHRGPFGVGFKCSQCRFGQMRSV